MVSSSQKKRFQGEGGSFVEAIGSWACHCSIKTQSEGVLTDRSKSCPTNNNTLRQSSLPRKEGQHIPEHDMGLSSQLCIWSCLHRDGGGGGCVCVCFMPTTTHKYLLRVSSTFKHSGYCAELWRHFSGLALDQWTVASGFWKLRLEVSEKSHGFFSVFQS